MKTYYTRYSWLKYYIYFNKSTNECSHVRNRWCPKDSHYKEDNELSSIGKKVEVDFKYTPSFLWTISFSLGIRSIRLVGWGGVDLLLVKTRDFPEKQLNCWPLRIRVERKMVCNYLIWYIIVSKGKEQRVNQNWLSYLIVFLIIIILNSLIKNLYNFSSLIKINWSRPFCNNLY